MVFWKKKKEEEKEELPEPPRFPEMGEIKRAIKPAPITPFTPKRPISEETAKLVPPITIPQMMALPVRIPPMRAAPIAPVEAPRRAEERSFVKELEEGPTAPITSAAPITLIAAKAPKLKEPIFVKIDRFEDALSNFEEIKRRLQESFELLEKIKKIRGKEQEEIDAWGKEIEELKEKLDSLDKKLFSRIEF